MHMMKTVTFLKDLFTVRAPELIKTRAECRHHPGSTFIVADTERVRHDEMFTKRF